VKRIAVTGPAGAGKSRLARDLGAAYGIEVLHLDTLFWRPGWLATPAAEFEAMQRRELERDSWIVDAQYDDMIPDWLDAADAVVFVDASPLRCLWRVSRRRLDRNGRPDLPAGSEPAPVHRALAKYEPQPLEDALVLQDHQQPVRYRNMWIRRIGRYDAR